MENIIRLDLKFNLFKSYCKRMLFIAGFKKNIFILFSFIISICSFNSANAHVFENNESSLEVNQKKYQLVACAIFQNETFFLREWIEYHRVVGVEHFYLYNNLSTDNYLEILRPYIAEGIVDLFDWPVETSSQRDYLNLLQLPAYNDALEKVKGKAKWAAFIDLDEFIVPRRHNNLVDMLSEYEEYAGIAINWQIFGTSNIEDLPKGKLVTESFTLKAPDKQGMNEIVKLIVQPQYVESILNPHTFQFLPHYYAVNSNGNPLNNNQMGQAVVLDTACINHYWFGSLNWLLGSKIPRREKWGIKLSVEHLEEIISSHNVVKDESIRKFIPALKNKMNSNPSVSQGYVTCDFMGQLGNQFFQIATATSLALDNEATPIFPGLITEKEFNVPLNYSKIFYHLNTQQPKNPVDYIYIEPQFPYSPIPFQPNMLIRGWFQSEKYFRHHKQEILYLFAPHPEISCYLQEKYSDILKQDNTVAIHYRSYALEDPQHLVYADCGMDYFTQAINMFPEDSIFVVCSNDIQWCKQNFSNLDRKFIFVENETHYHDLYLMSMCKHNIICNSSFSWWSAYLNKNPDKQIIAPKKWFNPKYEALIKGAQDLIPEEWITI